jgi:uncharacterized protein YutE (UPF0331/DUF86 family)
MEHISSTTLESDQSAHHYQGHGSANPRLIRKGYAERLLQEHIENVLDLIEDIIVQFEPPAQIAKMII